MLKVTHRDLIDRALAEVETLDIEEAEALLEDDDAVFVDLRDPRELAVSYTHLTLPTICSV